MSETKAEPIKWQIAREMTDKVSSYHIPSDNREVIAKWINTLDITRITKARHSKGDWNVLIEDTWVIVPIYWIQAWGEIPDDTEIK